MVLFVIKSTTVGLADVGIGNSGESACPVGSGGTFVVVEKPLPMKSVAWGNP
jgi:hypothetical protein